MRLIILIKIILIIAMVTYYVMERITTCSPIIGQCSATMIVASSGKEWLQWPIEILVLETVTCPRQSDLNFSCLYKHDSSSVSSLTICPRKWKASKPIIPMSFGPKLLYFVSKSFLFHHWSQNYIFISKTLNFDQACLTFVN